MKQPNTYEQASDKLLIEMYAEAINQGLKDENLEKEIDKREMKLGVMMTSISTLRMKRDLKLMQNMKVYKRPEYMQTEELSKSMPVAPIDELEGEFHRRKFNNDHK